MKELIGYIIDGAIVLLIMVTIIVRGKKLFD